MKNIEIELRYEVLDQQALTSFLQHLDFSETKQIVDIYLDTYDAQLYKRGIYIRLRNNKKIDIKFNRACLEDSKLEQQSYCEEYSFQLPWQQSDVDKINQLSRELGLQEIETPSPEEYKMVNNLIKHVTVDKMRSLYKIEDFLISVDVVNGLGTFLEIEIMASNINDLDLIKNRMLEILKELQLMPLKTGYSALLLKKQNFKQYVQGRFILEEDKVYRENV